MINAYKIWCLLGYAKIVLKSTEFMKVPGFHLEVAGLPELDLVAKIGDILVRDLSIIIIFQGINLIHFEKI